jgi:aminopeptidase N
VPRPRHGPSPSRAPSASTSASRPFAIRHIALDLTLHVDDKAISGTATLELSRVDPEATEIALDAVGFTLSAVELLADGKREKVAHVYDGETLRVTLPREAQAATIQVTYRATPRRGIYFLAPDEHVPGGPNQVWTQCQDEDARHIFPCHDKPHVKQTTELAVTVPADWYALSNGALESEQAGRFHWKMSEPHPSYLFTLVAGEFARIEDRVGDLPLSYLVPKGREVDGKRTFSRTPDMIRHFGELLGVPYPWNKYAQVVVSDFIFGGMENTTATTMYEFILLDERAALDISSDDLIAHELAHQWFGDLVTCRDWSHALAQRGLRHLHGARRSRAPPRARRVRLRRAGDMDAYFGEAHGRYRRPIVCQDYEAPIDIFDRHLYEKGGAVLHLLRRELGDALFWKGVSTYLKRHQKGVVETRDLMRALEEVSGRSLERFFEQWVFRAGHPELDVKIEHEGELCTITVKQTQHHGRRGRALGDARHGDAALRLRSGLRFRLRGRQGARARDAARRSGLAHLRVPRASRPRFVVVDPELAVLAEVKLEAPGDMLRNQIAEAPSARGRMLAGARARPARRSALGRGPRAALNNEDEFWGVRAEAAEALGNLRSEEAFATLEKALAITHPKVRRAVVAALGHFRSTKAAEALKKVALRDASYLVEAEAARSLGATKQAAPSRRWSTSSIGPRGPT